MDSDEDQRAVELSTLTAIFPEIHQLEDDANNEDRSYTFTLEIPVNPSKAVTVFFPTAVEGNVQDQKTRAEPQKRVETASGNGNVDSHELAYLPAICLRISLPPSYPAKEPPIVSLTTSPSWIPSATAQKLEDDCARLWEELGYDMVVFTYIDHIQQSSHNVFDLVNDAGALEISPEHKIAILDYDIKAKQAAFDKETFDCSICLDPKKGAKCHRMLDCGHVFCIQCLQDFYNNAIQEGDITIVRCLTPGCTKEREAAQASSATSSKKKKKPDLSISPSELLQIPLEADTVKRYVALKYKTELESDKNTIYCPRSWCQGAARSKRHKKPEGFQLHQEEHDSDEEDNNNDSGIAKPYVPEERLAVCEDCGFAFCSRCRQGWHGDFVVCTRDRSKDELSEEEKASLEFINLHTSRCPTCTCPAQKTQGCNHMICFKCQSHFCYLCMAWLDPANPYQHFNRQPDGSVTSCYMRLWELEEGDENGQYAFAGGRQQQEQQEAGGERQVEAVFQPNEGEQDEHDDDDDELPFDFDFGAGPWDHLAFVMPRRDPPPQQPERNVNGRVPVVDRRERPAPLHGAVDVAREAPLVLRLDVVPGQQPPPPQQQQRQQQQTQNRLLLARGNNNRRGGHGRGQRQQPAARGLGRGGGARGMRGRGAAAGGGVGMARREPHIDRQLQDDAAAAGVDRDDGGEQLEARDAEWIRHFVQLALEDNEHLLDDDDDE